MKSNKKVNSFTLVIFLGIFVFLIGRISAENFKIIDIPGNIKIEENVARVSIVNNLSKTGEIYRAGDIIIIGDAIYATFSKTCEVIKFNLNGKIESRVGRAGAGPAEFKWICPAKPYKNQVAVLDQKLRKIAIFNQKLELIKEFRLKFGYTDFFVDKQNRFIFISPSDKNYYFEICSEEGKPEKFFGKTKYPQSQKIVDGALEFEDVWVTLYIPDQNGVLAGFSNRYDLLYYKNEKQTLEIRAARGFFKSKVENIMGKKYKMPNDRVLHLARSQNRLYYFYNRSQKTFCDIFDINNFRLIRRLRIFPGCVKIAQYKENIFYGFGYDSNQEDDLILVKIII